MHLSKRWRALALAGLGIALGRGAAFAAAPVISTSDWPGMVFLGYHHISRAQQIVVGYPYRYQIVATNSPSYYDATGLPGGLAIDHDSGVISGSPNAAGDFSLMLQASNADGLSSPINVTLTVQPAPTEAPELTLSDIDSQDPGFLGRDTGNYVTDVILGAVNAPTSFTATGYPSAYAQFDSQNGVFTYGELNESLPFGIYAVQVTATNPVGSGSGSFVWRVHPRVMSLTPDKSSYTDGETITLTATFDGKVVVSGMPYVALRTGTRRAVYASGSGTSRLIFKYSTTAADGAFSESLSRTIELDGGSINHTSGVSAVLSVPPLDEVNTPAYSVSNGTTTTSGPVITTVRPPPDDIYGAPTSSANAYLSIQVTFSNPVTFTPGTDNGRPVLGLRIGSTDYQAFWTSGGYAGTYGTNMVFLFPIQGNGPLTVTGPVSLHGGTIKDQDGKDASLTFSPVSAPGVIIDTTPPGVKITGVNPASPTSQQSFTVFGTCEPGSRVDYHFAGTSSSLQVPADGNWSVNFGPHAAGTYSFAANAQDQAGNWDVPGIVGPDATGIGITITDGPPSEPPPTNPPGVTPPPSTGGPGTQTVTFVTPVSAILVGQPIALGATSSSGLPIAYSLVSGNATLDGTTLTIHDTHPVVVRATSFGNNVWLAASTDATFNASKRNQAIVFPAIGTKLASDSTITLAATSDSGLPITYTLVSGPATLSGNVLTLTGGSGTVVLRASQDGNDTFNAAGDATVSFAVKAAGQQVYLGTIGSDRFALVVAKDDSRGTFLMRIGATGEVIVAKFVVQTDGTFAATTTGSTGATRTISGRVLNGIATGTIKELNANFTALVQPAIGTTAALAGLYTTAVPGSADGNAYLVVGPAGQTFAMTVTPKSSTAGLGTIASTGAASFTAGDTKLNANVAADGGIKGSMTVNGATVAIAGLSDGVQRTDKLVNLSSRLRVVGGDATRSVIAGFVVEGTAAKKVLVRAVGPGLAQFGIGSPLANPSLQLFDSQNHLVASNDDWSGADVSATADAVGAFKLDAGSKDAALVATLAPGAYTAMVTGVNSNGIVLVEVYDASTNAAIGTQQLINISTRGYVDTGDASLIAGFVVTGNAPKKVLIRGVGPGLEQFLGSGALGDPVLKVYDVNQTLVAQNDNWGTAQTVNATQVAATAADITAAAQATGAFPLDAGSKDAAIVITLLPGNYSAVVTGANNSTGAGLVEVYEIPNP